MENQMPNRLINEKSPYLLQHAYNPVDWLPWGEEALDRARRKDKLLLVSIGYAACHWCHVMEKESFEDKGIAQIMNEEFVCIKVDREERPDIDKVYMDAVHLINGSGGWPLNCFALPTGEPVFGGTYFKKEQFRQVLQMLANVYKKEKYKVLSTAKQITNDIKAEKLVAISSKFTYSLSNIHNIIQRVEKTFDMDRGGYKGIPKFILPDSLSFLLEYAKIYKDNHVLDFLSSTASKVLKGGVYDQVGGGVARYSVDEDWKVPHFEKMLYDNALFITFLVQLYGQTKHEKLKIAVYEITNFLEKELLSPEGGYYSSIDADSEGEEGKFYCWDYKELEVLLEERFPMVRDYFNIEAEGNWVEKNILHSTISKEDLASKYRMKVAEVERDLQKAKEILKETRETRERPRTDTKILLSWNALLLQAFCDAYEIFGDKCFLDKAMKQAKYIHENHVEHGGLIRVRASKDIKGFLDDYAYWIAALIKIFRVTGKDKWLNAGKNFMEKAIHLFYDPESGYFRYSSIEEEKLIKNSYEIMDNVMPSSNSVMGHNLYTLSMLYGNAKYGEMAERMLSGVQYKFTYGVYFSNWLSLGLRFLKGDYSLIFKDRAENVDYPYVFPLKENEASSIPIFKGKKIKDGYTYLLCSHHECFPPIKEIKEISDLIV